MPLFSQIQALSGPFDDRLQQHAKNHAFRDSLRAPISQHTLAADELQFQIFAHMPSWVNALMDCRNRLVAWLGFNTGEDAMVPKQTPLNVGDRAGFLTVIDKTHDEIICESDDPHMTFYLSVKKADKHVIISTLVNPKSWVGRGYLRVILPFHYLIARCVIQNALSHHRI